MVAREVTLLPRHWEWPPPSQAAPPRRSGVGRRGAARRWRRAADARLAGRRVQVHDGDGGDLAGYEEATRALYAKDRLRFERCVAQWPEDVRAYAATLAEAALS